MLSTNPDELIAAVQSRTKGDIVCLHYAHTREGFYCLDFGQWAPTMEAMDTLAIEAYHSFGATDSIPMVTSESRWRALLDRENFTYRSFRLLHVQTLAGT